MMTTVLAFFASESIPVARLEERSMAITSYQGRSGTWRCIASVDDEAETFAFYSLLDVRVDPARRSELVEFLMRATTGLVVGNFDFDYSSESISFKTSIDVEGDRLTPALVANIVTTNLMIVDHYLPSIAQVAAGLVSAQEAIAEIDTDEVEV